MASSALVELQAENRDAPGGGSLARYSTREMVEVEVGMAFAAEDMVEVRSHGVERKHVDHALAAQDAAIRSAVSGATVLAVERGELTLGEQLQQMGVARLSDEQREAVEHVTGPEQISVVVGYAGAGKSTMLAAAREAWEAQGYRVHGAALAGKAAEGLEESSGIRSRTLASWEYGWQNPRSGNRSQLGKGDVLVVDEAGMVGSKQLARFVGEANQRGSKIVLVGDHEQLQAIGAGAPFRAIAERVGSVQLSEIRRQREDWQRTASADFASHRTVKGLAAYNDHGAVRLTDTRDGARSAIVDDYLEDRQARPEGSRIALAHRRVDVHAINADIRAARQERGDLVKGEQAGEITYQTNEGERAFAPGDRIVFLENNRDLDVKNGMLGTVEAVETGRVTAKLDGKDRSISVSVADYAAIDHGYATTIHKSQGATVDRAFVLASSTMDRHLTYVSMTRHRDDVQLYASRDEFRDIKMLSTHLGRSGAKETTLDYISDFASRRGIAGQFGIESEIGFDRATGQSGIAERLGIEESEMSRRLSEQRDEGLGQAKQVEDLTDDNNPKDAVDRDLPVQQNEGEKPRRGMFDGLKLNPRSDRNPEATQEPTQKTTERQDREAGRLRSPTSFEQSVDRYARAYSSVEQMKHDRLPILESQKEELQDAGQQLDKIDPGSLNIMQSAIEHHPETKHAVLELSGRERTDTLVKGIERERQLQADPNIRADRAISLWQELDVERQKVHGQHDAKTRQRIEDVMRKITDGIKRDPQVEAIRMWIAGGVGFALGVGTLLLLPRLWPLVERLMETLN